ncbi:MAG: substrate-binding domain-containing protein [bacterium]|nr:substrate-binding domain-containing protein [bacterium]
MRKHLLPLLVALLLLFTVVAVSSAQDAPLVLGLSVPSLEEEGFFATLVAEAQAAAEDADAELVVLNADNDVATEASNIEQLIADAVSAILLYPVDVTSAAELIAQANEANIPVLLIGATLPTDAEAEVAATVGADAAAVGELAASFFCENAAEGSTVVALSGIAGLEEDTELDAEDARLTTVQGQLEGLAAAMEDNCAGVNVVAETTETYTNADSLTFAGENLNRNVDGVFVPNAELALEMVGLVRELRLRGLNIVTLGVTPETLGALETNRLAGIISATPESLGKLSVETAVALLGGDEVEAAINADLTLVDADSVAAFRCLNPGGC